MRKLILVSSLAALALATPAFAHPGGIRYESRGQCEAAFAGFSKFDRERLVDVQGVFDTYGEAQRTFRDIFKCEYDHDDDAWYIVLATQS